MSMHRYQTIDLSYFDTAPVRLDDRFEVAYPPDLIWTVFEDNVAWHDFDPGIAVATWTSPLPLHPGSTRRVELNKWLGGGTIDEVFFEWKPSEYFAFYMAEGSSGLVKAYGELWSFKDLGGDRTEIRLRTAFELSSPILTGFARLMTPVLNWGYTRTLKEVGHYLGKRYAHV